ncbi:TolC family outer membrane protein [Billgrantia gudaonensis]|uniref:Outer membrane protein, adhesin transport system n=1 Tax=Billgrantia gudaonensis TaxID=376427 RepID=A0A1G9D8H6_9GAMM|nr:TolC family outer membrane protein [Halomonas gudaonensis]SDK60151.1 outer membrane protein, adhesin transport system [Halomonas gudaonensis]
MASLAGLTSTLALLPLASAMAQGLPQGMSSSGSADLRGVIQQAMATNPEVRAAWNEFQASGHDRREAWGNYLPSIDISAGVGREDREDDFRGSYDSQFAELSLNQMIYDGFATQSEVERLDRARLVRYYELLGASEEVALEAARAYLDVRRYRELVTLAQENYAEHMRVYDQIEERVRSGAGRGVDLQQINGRLALAESNLMTEASNLHDVSARYQRIVGDLPAENLAPAPELDERIPASVAEAVDLAFQGNPDFHAAIENIEAKRAEESQTQAAFQPRLDLRARTGTYENNDGSYDPLGRRDRHRVELVASMNLYNGGSDLASFRAASERVEQATDLRDKACHDVRQTAQIAYNDTQRLREQLDYLNQHRQSIDRVRGAYQQQFDIGERTLLDLLDSENEYFEASRAYVNAVYDIRIADARTLAAMGELMQSLEVMREDMPTLAELGSDGVSLDPDTVCPVQGPSGFTLDDLTRGLGSTAPAPERAPDVTLSADALFAINSAELDPGAREELDELADQIRQRDDLARVFIAGHADSTGSDAINDPLSQRRADSVASYLVSQGVSADLIETRGYGSGDPVASNDSADGRRQNRRVEVTLESRGESAANFDLDSSPNVSQLSKPTETSGERQVASESSATETRETFLQVAALSRQEAAESLRNTLTDTLDEPTRTASGGGLHRVLVGPLTAGDLDSVQQRLGDLGYRDAYVTRS